MAFNGVGVFSRVYSWVNDAANNLFISSSRMDTEMDGFAAGLSNCITRDGQSPASNDIPLGGHKITGLAPGVALTDAATVAQTSGTQWSFDTSAASYVGPTQFKALGADKTTFYYPGRRVEMQAPGPNYRHGTVSAVSTYAAPDTTVTVVVDGAGGVVDPGITKVAYGLLDYFTPAYLSPRTAMNAVAGSALSYAGATWIKFPFNVVPMDTLGEFDAANYRFYAKYPGVFRISGNCAFVANATGFAAVSVALYKNGSPVGTYAFLESKQLTNANTYSQPFSVLYPLTTVGDYLEIYMVVNNVAWMAAAATASAYLCIDRIV